MSGIDFTNVEALSAQIAALQQGGQTANTAGTSGAASSPDSFILQTQLNFNSMLQNLMAPADSNDQNSSSSDPFASLTNDQTLQTQIQKLSNPATATPTGAQNLVTLDQTSQLLGKQAIYQSQTGGQVSGVIAKILLDQQGNAVVEMTDGLQIPASAIIGLKQ
jgi:hypothetical protein